MQDKQKHGLSGWTRAVPLHKHQQLLHVDKHWQSDGREIHVDEWMVPKQ